MDYHCAILDIASLPCNALLVVADCPASSSERALGQISIKDLPKLNLLSEIDYVIRMASCNFPISVFYVM